MNSQIKPILVCGDTMLDEYWFGEVARISPEAPVPVVLVTRQEDRFGAADNVAANIQALGGETYTAVCNTSHKIRLVARNQQVARIDFDFEPQGLDGMEGAFRDALPKVDIVVFSDYGKGTLKNIKFLISEAKAAGKLVLVDPKGHDYHKYAGADLVKPNLEELRHVVGGWGGEEQLHAKVKLLLEETSIRSLLLTRASEGMSLYGPHGADHYSSHVQEICDVTGAGDTAIAALAVAVSRRNSYRQVSSLSIREAIPLANKAAGIVCGKFGTRVCTEEELFGTL